MFEHPPLRIISDVKKYFRPDMGDLFLLVANTRLFILTLQKPEELTEIWCIF